MKKELERYYTHRAHTYDELDKPRSIIGCVREIGVKDHMKIISPKPNEMILDVGCGIGRFLTPFSRSKVYGVDMNAEMLGRAKKPGVPILRCDAEYLPFKNCVFDITHSAGLLGVYRSKRIIEEIGRVTKRNGKMFVSFPAAYSVSGLAVSLFNILNYNPSLMDFWYTKKDIYQMFPKEIVITKFHRLGWELPFQRWYKKLDSKPVSKLFLFLEIRLRDKHIFKYFGGRFLVEAQYV